MISEQTSQLQELRRQLSLREQEVREVKRDKEREVGGETERLQSALKEKEAFIKVPVGDFPSASLLACVRLVFTMYLIHQDLMQGQEEAMQLSSKESEAEMKALQEELQLVLKKEREAQKELSALRLSLTHQQTPRDTKTSSDHQVGVCIFLSQFSSNKTVCTSSAGVYLLRLSCLTLSSSVCSSSLCLSTTS